MSPTFSRHVFCSSVQFLFSFSLVLTMNKVRYVEWLSRTNLRMEKLCKYVQTAKWNCQNMDLMRQRFPSTANKSPSWTNNDEFFIVCAKNSVNINKWVQLLQLTFIKCVMCVFDNVDISVINYFIFRSTQLYMINTSK